MMNLKLCFVYQSLIGWSRERVGDERISKTKGRNEKCVEGSWPPELKGLCVRSRRRLECNITSVFRGHKLGSCG